MGGFGSGDWDREKKKTTIEECFSLDVNHMAREGKLHIGAAGGYDWEDHDGKPSFFVEFSTSRLYGGQRILQLSYRWEDHWNEENSQDITLPIRLQASHVHFGGVRWWFLCPLATAEGLPCRRRVCQLYLPPGEKYFGCRICHDLTYRSCQEAHQLERLMAPGRVEKIMEQIKRLKAKHGWET